MNSDTTVAQELDVEEPEQPKRRPKPTVAQPAEPIPETVNAAHLADLFYERAISMARALASAL